MGLMDFFSKKSAEPELDPLQDLVLDKLRVGFLVDYDLETWEVTAYNRYDFDGDVVEEWELTTGRKKRYLERAEDDAVEWTLARKVAIGKIEGARGGGGVREYVIAHDDPPEQVTFEGDTYFLDESAAGYMYAGGGGAPKELLKWEFLDDSEERFLTVEQWGETDLEAAAGVYVEEHEFSNILPGK